MKINNSKIGIDDLIDETDRLLESIEVDRQLQKQNKVSNILNELLGHIETVNFRDYCNLDNDKDKLQKKHYLVACIE